MPSLEVHSLKMEIEKHEKILTELHTKWEEYSTSKQLSPQIRSAVVQTVVSAKRLATIVIPRLKFKIDLAVKTPKDTILQESVSEQWETIKPKIERTLKEFEMLESGKRPEYPTKERKQQDLEMSKNIEKHLKNKKIAVRTERSLNGASISCSEFLENGRGDMGLGEQDKKECQSKAKDLSSGDGSEPAVKVIQDDNTRTLVDNVKHFKQQLARRREREGSLSEIVEDVCPDDAASVKQYLKSLAASETTVVDEFLSPEMLDEIRGFDQEEVEKRKADRKERLAKSKEIRERRIQKLEKLAEAEPELTRPSLPAPLPIEGFLNLVETLPGEIRKLVSKETEELSNYYKNQVFLKQNPLSSHKGMLINMEKLKKELRDDRFDASDFHISTEESTIAEEHLKWLKEQGVDNAVGRYFGTFSSQIDLNEDEVESSKYPDDMKICPGRVLE